MDKFSHLFNLYCDGKYDYLRIKNVEINTEAHTANVYIYVREDKYDKFDNAVIRVLRSFFGDIVPKYNFYFHFERLLVSDDLVHRHVTEFLTAKYPFVSANILLDNIDVDVDADTIKVTFYMPAYIIEYVRDGDFVDAVKEDVADAFIMQTEVEIRETDVVVEEDTADSRVKTLTAVPVKEIRYLCGQRSDYSRMPTMISYVRQPADRTAICGEIRDFKVKTYEQPPEETDKDKKEEGAVRKRKFYKYHYTFMLYDGTEEMRVLYNTNDEKCPLQTHTTGELMVRGRVFYNERQQSMNMFAKTVFTCAIDKQKLADALKPLPVPDKYRIEPTPAITVDKPVQLTIGIDEVPLAEKRLSGSHVFLYLRSVARESVPPYELCALRTENGKPTLQYHTFVYMADVLQIEMELKNCVSTAPRMAEVLPDLVKFTEGATVVALQLEKVQGYLTEIAKALRYVFACEWWDAGNLLKKGKEILTFVKACRAKQIAVESDAASDKARALYQLYLSEKGIG